MLVSWSRMVVCGRGRANERGRRWTVVRTVGLRPALVPPSARPLPTTPPSPSLTPLVSQVSSATMSVVSNAHYFSHAHRIYVKA